MNQQGDIQPIANTMSLIFRQKFLMDEIKHITGNSADFILIESIKRWGYTAKEIATGRTEHYELIERYPLSAENLSYLQLLDNLQTGQLDRCEEELRSELAEPTQEEMQAFALTNLGDNRPEWARIVTATLRDDPVVVTELIHRYPHLLNAIQPSDDLEHVEWFVPLLHSAAAGDKVMAIRTLVELGADVELADRSGHRPLCEAIMGGHKAAAALLVELGAQPARCSEHTLSLLRRMVAGADHSAEAEIASHMENLRWLYDVTDVR